MNGMPWQLELVKRSLKKKEKISHLRRLVRPRPGARCLDLGCAQGILSHFLRLGGGRWTHADQDLTNLRTTRALVGNSLVRVAASSLPFGEASFDLVAAPDYLEHVEDDGALAAEIARVLKPGGRLVTFVPHSGRFFLLHKLRPVLGMSLEFYGHKREGYSLDGLSALLSAAGLVPAGHLTYSKFFSEFLELLLNALYVRFLAPAAAEPLRDGRIRPTTAGEFASSRKPFRLYGLVYPLVWVFSRLDALLFFQRGYSLAVWADKRRGD
ncbi:MAG: methyltransferase domain-containing protein [Candidatus Aminicenantes bacterium]|nr:methyltransferase domain-containing protein [Candidatus Aminicenantes bacterium]